MAADGPFPYRASEELAAALFDFRERVKAFDVQVDEFNAAHPGHEVVWTRGVFTADPHPRGFADDTAEVPPGLSRAKSRTYLVPRRGRAGEPWRAALARFGCRPSVGRVFRQHGVREHGDGPGTGTGGYYIASTRWFDAGDDGVIVVCKYDIGVDRNGAPDLSEHLTPLRLSEYYRIRESLDEATREAS